LKLFAKKFYKSKAWLDCRNSYVISKHGICETCGDAGLIVHHKEKLTPMNINNPNITLCWDRLELLCLQCHNKVHSQAGIDENELMFDINGDIIPPG
jgi:5-methylcytosine-specific restriction endonuclease McrA